MTYVKYVPARKARNAENCKSQCCNPPVDIVESKDEYRLDFDLPGFAKEDVKVSVAEGVLTVSGERKDNREYDENYFRYFERRQGEFSRSFRLPDTVDGEKIEAAYENGVVSLTLPKKEEAKPFSVEIK